jgi:hypothetical protein
MKNRINLLAPATIIKTSTESEGINKVLAIVCLVSVVAVFGFYGFLFMTDYNTKSKIQQAYSEIAGMQEVDKQARERDVYATEIKKTKLNFDRLKLQRPMFTKYLDEFKRLVPAGIDLVEMEITYQPFKLIMQGNGLNHLNISQFCSNLQQSETFKDCLIDFSNYIEVEKRNEFKITITSATEGGKR